jgi:UDP-N-acetyl-D-glucosamine dehydrogenase
MVTVTHHQLLPYKELADLGVPIFDTRNAFKTYDLPHIYKLGTPLTALEEIHLELAY